MPRADANQPLGARERTEEPTMWKRLIALGLFTSMALVGALGYAALKAPPTASGPIQAVALQSEGASNAASSLATGSTVFEIQPGASTATFQLTEVLRGQPTTVVGRTQQVSGQIAVDLDEPTNAQVGTILIN